MTKPVAGRSDAVARRSEGTGVTGAGPAGVSGNGRERGHPPTSRVRRTRMVTMGAGLGQTPAAPGTSPPRVGLGQAAGSGGTQNARDAPEQERSGRGCWGVAGTLQQLLGFCSAPLPRAGASSLGPAPLKWGCLHRAAVCPPTALP